MPQVYPGYWGQNDRMCGRYVMSKATGDLLAYYDAMEAESNAPAPSWNVAPTQSVPIIAERLEEDVIERKLLVARWGLVPSWAKDIKIGSKLLCTKTGKASDVQEALETAGAIHVCVVSFV